MADVFTSQSSLKQKATGASKMDYSTDNLFAGVWRLDQTNLDRFDPFIQGYAFVMWTKLPAFFESDIRTNFQHLTEKNFKSFSGIGDMTLQVEDLTTGFAGNAYGVATNLQKENTSFTLTHYELAGSPIRELYQYWITGIRDPETGLAHYHGKLSDSMQYSAKNHTGELLYVVTDPSGAAGGASGIEYAAYYTNVMPTKIPQDHLNYSSGDHGLVEIQIDFRGNYHQSKEINELAVTAMQSYKIQKRFGDYKLNGAKDAIRTSGYDEDAEYGS
jgi:hypothetical protein